MWLPHLFGDRPENSFASKSVWANFDATVAAVYLHKCASGSYRDLCEEMVSNCDDRKR